jgi:hypothetical protein
VLGSHSTKLNAADQKAETRLPIPPIRIGARNAFARTLGPALRVARALHHRAVGKTQPRATAGAFIEKCTADLKGGNLAGAIAALETGLQHLPGNTRLIAKLTELCARNHDWTATVKHATEHAARSQGSPLPQDSIVAMHHALALFHLGHRQDALHLITKASETADPCEHNFRTAYVNVLANARALDELTTSFSSGVLSVCPSRTDLKGIEVLVRCNRTRAARLAFAQGFEGIASPTSLPQMVKLVSITFDGAERESWFKKIDASAAAFLESEQTPKARALLFETRLKTAYGLNETPTFNRVTQAYATEFPDAAKPHQAMLARMTQAHDPSHQPRKIFGIGAAKTGTTSLTRALQILGFDAIHLRNPYSEELIRDRDIPLFDAFTDTPIAHRFKDVFRQYPDAMFIYTARPVDQWVVSLLKHFRRDYDIQGFADLDAMINGANPVRHGALFRDIHTSM